MQKYIQYLIRHLKMAAVLLQNIRNVIINTVEMQSSPNISMTLLLARADISG